MTDNETIADWMGGKFEKREIMTYGGLRHGKWTFDNDRWCYDDQLDYSTDWRWLMPVWYKFRDLKFKVGDNKGTHWTYKDLISDAIVNKGPTPSEACRLLADGIRWYKTIKQ